MGAKKPVESSGAPPATPEASEPSPAELARIESAIRALPEGEPSQSSIALLIQAATAAAADAAAARPPVAGVLADARTVEAKRTRRRRSKKGLLALLLPAPAVGLLPSTSLAAATVLGVGLGLLTGGATSSPAAATVGDGFGVGRAAPQAVSTPATSDGHDDGGAASSERARPQTITPRSTPSLFRLGVSIPRI